MARINAYLRTNAPVLKSISYDGASIDDGFSWGGQRFGDYQDASNAIAAAALKQAGNDLLPDDELALPDLYA